MISNRLLAGTLLLSLLIFTACDDAPPDPVDVPAPIRAQQIDVACTQITSCLPPGSETVTDCIASTMTRPASGLRLDSDLLDCLESAGTDCDAVTTCLPGTESGENPCDGRGNDVFCEGNLLIRCFAQAVDSATDCHAWGLSCSESDDFDPTCLGEGPSCIRGDQRCDGDDAVLCIGFREVAFDCSDLVTGRVCTNIDGNVRCGPSEPECDPRVSDATCDEDQLVFCSAAGTTTRVDCLALGFAGCVTDTGQANCGS